MVISVEIPMIPVFFVTLRHRLLLNVFGSVSLRVMLLCQKLFFRLHFICLTDSQPLHPRFTQCHSSRCSFGIGSLRRLGAGMTS